MATKTDLDEKVSIITLNGGAAVELFDDELQKVLDNIGDVNTKPDAAREVQLIVKFKPDERRKYCDVTILAKSKQAPTRESSTVLFLGKTKEGQVVASERNTDQMTIEEAEAKAKAAGDQSGPRPVAAGK